ncbi:MAG: hypothetical protein K2M69_10115 [Muribaculaceae bacterium]|nr:hypothetical protein [Muribaculaceae bacterium]
MDSKLSRIAAFIDSLPEESMLGKIHSTVLSTDLNILGGTPDATSQYTNGTDCTNDGSCKGLSNGGNCRNMKGGCDGSFNGGSCYNEMKPLPPIVNVENSCG